ncbi:MAG: lysophospholipid acyltransferase family protein [Rhodospirillales bacterium]
MQTVRSLIYDVLQTVITIGMLLLLWVLLIVPWPAMLWVISKWAHLLRWLSRWVVGLDVRVRGFDKVPEGPVVIASKHQSAWDTAVFLLFWPRACYVMKKELWSIPFWGWYARHCQTVPVDRSGGASALRKMLSVVQQRLAEGRQIIVFPEGTRVAPGDDRKYHPGIAAIYQAADVPVVPVALNSGLFWGRRSLGFKHSGAITVEFRDPIPPGLDRKAFMERLKTEIDGATHRLESEARAEFPSLPGPGPDENT